MPSFFARPSLRPWVFLGLSTLATTANALCECGYSVNKTSDAEHQVYTDLMESDFLHAVTLNESGWRPQEYNVTAKDARGPYGKHFLVSDVITNPLMDEYSWTGNSQLGGDPGLQMWVRSDTSGGFVGGSEITTDRTDMQYGSYRVGMKLAGQSGTCGAFFWFFNNSREIDLEFLSSQFNDSIGTVNLVLQTPDSVRAGYDAANTSDFKVQALPFNPDQQYHEYRFDWSPGKVSFYADGQWLYDMTDHIPTDPGRLFMNHWSNGDDKWSGGPPKSDTVMTVSYVKAYFNSTNQTHVDAYNQRCPSFNADSVCQIPDQTTPPDPSGSQGNQTGHTYFFTLDADHSPGQIVYNTTNSTIHKNGAISQFASSHGSIFAYAPLAIALFSAAFAL